MYGSANRKWCPNKKLTEEADSPFQRKQKNEQSYDEEEGHKKKEEHHEQSHNALW